MSRPALGRKRLQLHLPPETIEALRAEATRHGVALSDLAAEILATSLARRKKRREKSQR